MKAEREDAVISREDTLRIEQSCVCFKYEFMLSNRTRRKDDVTCSYLSKIVWEFKVIS